jgi:hypothetical protein
MIKLILLLLLTSCDLLNPKLSPEEVALRYQKTRYTDYEDSFQYLWPNSVKKDDFLKFKVSYINFEKIKHKFKFEVKKTEVKDDERIVTIDVTRPDIESISKDIYIRKIGQNKETIEKMIFEELSKDSSPVKTIPTKVFLKQYQDKRWYVLPKVN